MFVYVEKALVYDLQQRCHNQILGWEPGIIKFQMSCEFMKAGMFKKKLSYYGVDLSHLCLKNLKARPNILKSQVSQLESTKFR